MPIAAIFALSEMIEKSNVATTAELMESVKAASEELKASLSNPIPATAGLELFMRFVTTKNWAGGVRLPTWTVLTQDFQMHKQSLISTALEFARNTVPNCRARITSLLIPFIKDDTVILTHGYSRVVMQVLLTAVKTHGKHIKVYVTESRPSEQGYVQQRDTLTHERLKTYNRLRNEGVQCTVVLDTAVAYIIDKVDLCLIGAEGVAESGGYFNAVGSYQLGIISKAAAKPVFAVAERCVARRPCLPSSFKFMRLFPLSQYDVPIPKQLLPLPAPEDAVPRADADGTLRMTPAMEALNPSIDYTPPELVTFIVSDLGILTPSGVADALLAVYGGD